MPPFIMSASEPPIPLAPPSPAGGVALARIGTVLLATLLVLLPFSVVHSLSRSIQARAT